MGAAWRSLNPPSSGWAVVLETLEDGEKDMVGVMRVVGEGGGLACCCGARSGRPRPPPNDQWPPDMGHTPPWPSRQTSPSAGRQVVVRGCSSHLSNVEGSLHFERAQTKG